MSDIANHTRDSSAVGGVLSIQERIRALNETLDTVEQRQLQMKTTGSTTVNPASDDKMEVIANDTGDGVLSLPPVVKRSSVVDIWRMRDNQNANAPTTTTGGKVATGIVSKQIAASILFPGTNNEIENDSKVTLPPRIGSLVDPWTSKRCFESVRQEEKKEEDCSNDSEVSPATDSKAYAPVRTTASASPTPPPLPGSTRKKSSSAQATATRVNYNHHELSKNSYPLVDVSILQSTSSLSMSSGAVQPFDSPKSLLSMKNSSTSKVAMIREQLIRNSSVGQKNSMPTTSSAGAATATEIRQNLSNEQERWSSVATLEPTIISVSPKQPWKNRETTSTGSEGTGIASESNRSVVHPSLSVVSDLKNGRLKKQLESDGEIELADEETKYNEGQPIAAGLLSPSRNVSIADRWARRLADQKPAISEVLPVDMVRTGTLQDSDKKVSKGMEPFSTLLLNTFSTDRQEKHTSTDMLQSVPEINAPLPENSQKGKVTDRYKVVDTNAVLPSINHTVSPTISLLVKEHAARTPVLPYKSKRVNLPVKAASETSAASHVSDVAPIKSIETKVNLFGVDSLMTSHDVTSNSVMSAVGRQVEKHFNKVADRWMLNNNSNVGDNKSKDTSDIPRSFGKVTDRYKPKNNIAASEPGGSRFDSATVAELLKVHAWKTPAGKVRGNGIKYISSSDAQHHTSALSKNARPPFILHDESTMSPPKLHPNIVDRWTLREAIGSVTKPESDDDDLHVLPTNVKEPRTKNLDRSSDSAPNESNADPTMEAIQAGTYNVETLNSEPVLDYSPVTSNKGNVADRWKKNLVQAKENNVIDEGSDRSLRHQIHKQTDIALSKSSGENSLFADDAIGNVNSTDCKYVDDAVDETKEIIAEIKNSQMILPTVNASSNSPVRSTFESNCDYGPSRHPTKETLTRSSAQCPKPPDEIAAIPRASLKKNVDSICKTGSVQITSDQKDDIVRSTNSSAFNPWNNVAEASRGYPLRNIRTTWTAQRVETTQHANIQASHEEVALTRREGLSGIDTNQGGFRLDNRQMSYNLSIHEEDDLGTNNFVNQDRLYHVAASSNTITSEDDPEKQYLVASKTSTADDNSLSRTMSLSTKKLASDRATNKLRLQQYRGKAKKNLSTKLDATTNASLPSKLESTCQENDKGVSSRSASNPSSETQNKFDTYGRVAHISTAQETTHFDLNNLLQSSGHETGQSSTMEKSDFEQTGDTIGSSVSTTSSSPLASKAEKMLLDRRRRAAGAILAPPQEHTALPQALPSCGNEDEEHATHYRSGYINSDKPRLSTRYNTSARFIDTDTSTSAPVATAYDSESAESSCNESGATSFSTSGYNQDERLLERDTKDSSKRRKNAVKDPPGQLSKDQSLNLSSHSHWDSDWGGNGSMVSMDFDKFVSVVDEQVAAFRDFVGVGIKKHLSQVKVKPNGSRKPPPKNIPIDVEDVAIEVEYVEDSFDDDPKADLGFCTAPMDDIMRKSLNFTNGKERKACMGFQLSCNEMLPTGEPSCERKPSVRKQSKRHAYV